ncbi:unnamed protein product [Brachionus calyciflorus]|uniref:Uncharacterized protein n=1 Tax=Brachionus calyciflorus TaxID=104777 RepID=A0A813MER4_9BILA|nr:unnamed protein product [Brachionus calyciflorus]
MRYQGSNFFEENAKKSGIQTYEVNFLYVELATIGLGLFYKNLIKAKPENMFSKKYVHIIVFIFAMSYLCYAHWYFQNLDYWNITIDITSQLMITTQKLTLLAFSYYDSQKPIESLTHDQKLYLIDKLPNFLEFLSYIFNFQGIIIGPSCNYRDYINFINGNSFIKSKENFNNSDRKEPPVRWVVIKKIICVSILGYLSLKLSSFFSIKQNITDEMLQKPIWFRAFYMYMSILTRRLNYYFAWILADIGNNSSGFGFNGYENDGSAKWDLVSNVNFFALEKSTSVKSFIDNWNIQTRLWLRRIAYERLPFAKTIGVFVLSPLWHGFYGGYYLTFFSIALFVFSGRKIRKQIRPIFLKIKFAAHLYSIISWLVTITCISYSTIPFELYDFYLGIKFFNMWFWCLHLSAILILLLLRN